MRLVSSRLLHDPATFKTALAFDDVLLVPRLGRAKSRRAVSLAAPLSRRLRLACPLVSSNMDTVTEHHMAIAMAQAGGVGILHRFLSVSEQCDQVRRVKRAEAFIVEDPYSISEDETIANLKSVIRERGVKSMLVVDKGKKLCGIVTSRDLRFADASADARLVRDYMTPKARLHVAIVDPNRPMTPEDAKARLEKDRVEKLPLIDKDWNIKGLITSRDLYHHLNNPNSSHDKKNRFIVGAAIGVKSGDLERAQALVEAGVDCIVVDVAHGHSDLCIDQVRLLKKVLAGVPVDVIAGNVATGEGAVALVEAGADAVKVGVGPGSICTTRIVTGCGVPQLSAVMDVANAMKGLGSDAVPIIADGGIRSSGDITKALAAGAHTVMLGNLLAGTEESPGQVLTKNGKKMKIIRGMAGYGANLSNREKQQMKDIFDVVPEGVEAQVPYRGHVRDIIRQLCGGLSSGISYCGGFNIADLHAQAQFVRITGAGKKESGAHDVTLID